MPRVSRRSGVNWRTGIDCSRPAHINPKAIPLRQIDLLDDSVKGLIADYSRANGWAAHKYATALLGAQELGIVNLDVLGRLTVEEVQSYRAPDHHKAWMIDYINRNTPTQDTPMTTTTEVLATALADEYINTRDDLKASSKVFYRNAVKNSIIAAGITSRADILNNGLDPKTSTYHYPVRSFVEWMRGNATTDVLAAPTAQTTGGSATLPDVVKLSIDSYVRGLDVADSTKDQYAKTLRYAYEDAGYPSVTKVMRGDATLTPRAKKQQHIITNYLAHIGAEGIPSVTSDTLNPSWAAEVEGRVDAWLSTLSLSLGHRTKVVYKSAVRQSYLATDLTGVQDIVDKGLAPIKTRYANGRLHSYVSPVRQYVAWERAEAARLKKLNEAAESINPTTDTKPKQDSTVTHTNPNIDVAKASIAAYLRSTNTAYPVWSRRKENLTLAYMDAHWPHPNAVACGMVTLPKKPNSRGSRGVTLYNRDVNAYTDWLVLESKQATPLVTEAEPEAVVETVTEEATPAPEPVVDTTPDTPDDELNSDDVMLVGITLNDAIKYANVIRIIAKRDNKNSVRYGDIQNYNRAQKVAESLGTTVEQLLALLDNRAINDAYDRLES
jgi:hypothetical protein